MALDGIISKSKSIGVDAIYQYASAMMQFFIGALFYIYVIRLLSTSSVGAIALSMAIVGLFNVIFQVGLGNAARHFTSFHIGEGDFGATKYVTKRILILGVILSLAALLTLVSLSNLLSMGFFHTIDYSHLVRLLGIVLFGNIMYGILNGALLGLQKFKLSALINMLVWTLYYVLAIVMAIITSNISGVLLGWTTGILIGVIIQVFFILKILNGSGEITRKTKTAEIFVYSFPLLFASLMGYGASYVDRLIVAGLMTLSQLGIYNLSILIATSINFIVVPFNNILLPKFSEWYGKGEYEKIRNTYKTASLLLTVIFVPCALGIAGLSGILVKSLSNSEYTDAQFPLIVIVIAEAIFVTKNIANQAIASVRKTKLFIHADLISFSTNLVLSILLIRYIGLIGASVGYASAYASSFIILFYYAHIYNLTRVNLIGTVKVWGASVFMFIVMRISVLVTGANVFYLPIYILLGIFVYFSSIRYITLFSKVDQQILLSYFDQRHIAIRKFIRIFMRGTKDVVH